MPSEHERERFREDADVPKEPAPKSVDEPEAEDLFKNVEAEIVEEAEPRSRSELRSSFDEDITGSLSVEELSGRYTAKELLVLEGLAESATMHADSDEEMEKADELFGRYMSARHLLNKRLKNPVLTYEEKMPIRKVSAFEKVVEEEVVEERPEEKPDKEPEFDWMTPEMEAEMDRLDAEKAQRLKEFLTNSPEADEIIGHLSELEDLGGSQDQMVEELVRRYEKDSARIKRLIKFIGEDVRYQARAEWREPRTLLHSVYPKVIQEIAESQKRQEERKRRSKRRYRQYIRDRKRGSS